MKRSEKIQKLIDAAELDLQRGNITTKEYIEYVQSLLDDKVEALKEEQ